MMLMISNRFNILGHGWQGEGEGGYMGLPSFAWGVTPNVTGAKGKKELHIL